MKKLAAALIGAGLLSAHMGAVHATATADEAKKLGTTLTLFGAEKAGNKDGTIPEYTGGLTTAPAGFDKAKGVRPDPFASENPLFSIDAKNMDKYADKLSEGAKALMKAHADYRIDVYKTHRSVAYPKSVLDNTVKNATRAKVSDDGLSMQGARAGIPFPIPKNGNEVMLNFMARYQGLAFVLPKFSAYNVDSNGKLVLSTQGSYIVETPYYDEAKGSETLSRVRPNYTAPARRAGESAMVVDPIDISEKGRRAWQYLPGQRRVRVAPDLAYDTPNPGTSGMSTYDDVNLFNGKMDRFDFKLVGKKEMYIPYNAYRFVYNDKTEDVFGAKFINPATVRWELHRVWVVEATLKEGKRHVYSKRTFYVDEDSWSMSAVDQYDGRGQLWRPGFSYQAPAYDVPSQNSIATGHYDLISGTYYANLWPGAGGIKFADALLPDSAWTGDALAGAGVR
ncbi:DUF1329 domain-containing protein [Noviherbaspirillum saxi]|uniref:DUF1329 domain-containing protein n=1 Tax=Noviherbaspirillum saxi TaxID=2320863 RepID=A0A3A3FQN0_9BURK|nr:DUF1329 domain-containing protein [Noviherbaspirillum saxi]RJF98522.1 DUF1329 domain-containing protein [Noviherbaspirillum saxi]